MTRPFVFQIHGAQHSGSSTAVGPVGSVGYEDAAQLRAADTGSQPERCFGRRAQGVLHDVQTFRQG